MIGWTRRGEEERRRREAWFATLTPEEQTDEVDYQNYVGRVWTRSMPLFLLGWIVLFFLANAESSRIGEAPAVMIGFSMLPGSISCPFFLCIMKKKDWLSARRRCTTGDE